MYGGKFAFQNRLSWPYSWKEIYCFSLFYLVFEGNFQVQTPGWGGGAYIWRGILTGVFCVTSLGGLYLEGLIRGGAYFRNFIVYLVYLKHTSEKIPSCHTTSDVFFVYAALLNSTDLTVKRWC